MNRSYVQFNSLLKYPHLCHFSTTRHGGVSKGLYDSFNLSIYTGDDLSSVFANRKLLCDHFSIKPENLIIPWQTHEDKIALLDEKFTTLEESTQKELLTGVDALITNQRNICLGVTTADCVPILLFDPVNRAVAAIHAGWKGTVAHIAQKCVIKMSTQYGTEPKDVVACIAPSIGYQAFEVGVEVASVFQQNGFEEVIHLEYPKPHIDLWEANRLDLMRAGVLPQRVEIAGICTYTDHETYFSARRLGVASGRCVTAIMLTDNP